MIDGNSAELKKRKDGSYYLALDTGVYSNHLQDTNDYSISDGTNTYTATKTAKMLEGKYYEVEVALE